MKNEIDIEECRLVYEALRKDGSPLSVRAGKALAWSMAELKKALEQPKPKAKDRVKCDLHPLHREIILLFQKSIVSEKRDAAEFNAWRKIEGIATAKHIAILKRFYSLPKSRENDGTWNRKNNAATLMNNFVSQVEIATAYVNKMQNRYDQKEAYLLPEPSDWRNRVAGALPNYTWDYLCKNWPREAKALQDPSWQMDSAAEGMADLASLVSSVDREIRLEG